MHQAFQQASKGILEKSDPGRLLLPENAKLTFASFLKLDLDNLIWNNNHFYYSWAPWALDPNVRKGIKSVLFLDQVKEEIQLLTQELD
jgi:hypothetical protein